MQVDCVFLDTSNALETPTEQMLTRRLFPLACVLLLGCEPESEPVGEGQGSGRGSAGNSTSGGTEETSSGPADPTGDDDSVGNTSGPRLDVGAGSTGGCDEEVDCGACPPNSIDNHGCVDGEYVCDCIPIDSECNLEETVCESAENGKLPPEDVVDCGIANLKDTPEAYAAVRDCVLDSSAGQLGYKAFVQTQGIDSDVWTAYSSVVGFAYQEHTWNYDNYQGMETIWVSSCTPMPAANPGCEPGPALGLCIECLSEQPEVVCSTD